MIIRFPEAAAVFLTGGAGNVLQLPQQSVGGIILSD